MLVTVQFSFSHRMQIGVAVVEYNDPKTASSPKMSADLQWLLLRVCSFVFIIDANLMANHPEKQCLHREESPGGSDLFQGASEFGRLISGLTAVWIEQVGLGKPGECTLTEVLWTCQ